MNKKVDFVVAGTQKGGTSALDMYLRKHPEICMASIKEVHFFDREANFKDNTDYSKYHAFFNPKPGHKLIGEATPVYMYWYDAPKRIWQYNPEMKFIIVLRNPIERAFSHWNMERRRNVDRMSFWDAIQNEQIRCREALPFQHKNFSYIDRGFYTEQLRRIWHFFPKEQTLIIKYENLRYNVRDTLKDLFGFLNLQMIQNVESMDIHSTSYISSMTEKEYDYLKNIFSLEVKELEYLLGWDCSTWIS